MINKKLLCAFGKKSLITLLTGLSLFGFRYDELGDLQDYKTTPFIQLDRYINKTPIRFRFYNPRNDGIDDVVEYYKIKEDKNHRRYVDNPFIYVFDLNNNGVVDKGECLIDLKEDGLNGNEYWK